MIDLLVKVKEEIRIKIPSLTSVEIGLENGLSMIDYPMVRMEPIIETPSYMNNSREMGEFFVFIGVAHTSTIGDLEESMIILSEYSREVRTALRLLEESACLWLDSTHQELEDQDVRMIVMRFSGEYNV